MGRPTSYKPEYAEQARKLCLLGSTDKELADFFEVAESTIHLWKKDQPDFSESIKAGKQQADAEVASKLFHRAVGYEHEDVHINCYEGQIIETPVTKHYPPETRAAIYWLNNRQKGKWREKLETGVTDKDGNDVPMDDLALARRIAFVLQAGANQAEKES
jgi:hypothetical protein